MGSLLVSVLVFAWFRRKAVQGQWSVGTIASASPSAKPEFAQLMIGESHLDSQQLRF